MAINDDALAILRSLVLHVTTGSPLTEGEWSTVRTMATLMGAKIEAVRPPLEVEVFAADGSRIECNIEGELSLLQIGTCMWLVSHLIRLSGDIDRRRRRIARDLVEYFETRKLSLGLDVDRPILAHYLKHVPYVRVFERSTFLGTAWLPAIFLNTAPDLDNVALDRLFQTPASRLTLYKICYWFAAASRRRNAQVIEALARIRAELQLEDDERCLAISNAIAAANGTLPPILRDPERSGPIAEAIAARVVAGQVDTSGSDAEDAEQTAAERLIDLLPVADRMPVLAHVFGVVMRQTAISPASMTCIARLVDAIDPSEGELTGLLLRHELDSGQRIKLPRAYTIDYGKQQTQRPRRSRI